MLTSMGTLVFAIFKFLFFTLLDCVVGGMILLFIILVIEFIRYYYVSTWKEKQDKLGD